MSSDSRLMFLPVWSSCCRKHLTTLKFWLLPHKTFASQSLVCRALNNRGKGNFKRKWVNRKEKKTHPGLDSLRTDCRELLNYYIFLFGHPTHTHARTKPNLIWHIVLYEAPNHLFFFSTLLQLKIACTHAHKPPQFSLEWLDAHSEPRQVSGSLCPALACFYKKFNSILVY